MPLGSVAEWANVKDYGAVGDYKTDDTVAIQKAIDSGKPVIYFPYGLYVIKDTIFVRGNARRFVGPCYIVPRGFKDADRRSPDFQSVIKFEGVRRPVFRLLPSKAGLDFRQQDVLAVALMDMVGHEQPEALVLERDSTVTVFRNPGKDVACPRLLRKRIWMDGSPPLAAHFGAWSEGKAPHVMVIRENGPTRYSLSGEAADLDRLIGFTPMYRDKPRHFPMPDFLASVAWDRNGGDGHLDLLVASKRGLPVDLEIIGRGHGAFFWNTEGKVSWRPLRDTRPHSNACSVKSACLPFE